MAHHRPEYIKRNRLSGNGRIKYLNDLVDYFVVVEADITHQGKKKEWNFPHILKTSLKNFSH